MFVFDTFTLELIFLLRLNFYSRVMYSVLNDIRFINIELNSDNK